MAWTDPDSDLGERDHEEEVDFPPSERSIHTQGYDLSLSTLKEQWDDKILILPEFQRDYVWDNAKAGRLVESLLLNIPIPPLYFSENSTAQYEIVDGHQRVFSVVRFLDNQFALSGLRLSQEFKGLRFYELPDREQRFLKTRMMRAIIISADSSEAMKFEVFERLNTGGLALNAQEIRHAIYGGSLNGLLIDLETEQSFRTCLGTAKPRKRMVDRELILRFFAMRDEFGAYRPPLVRFLNEYMEDNRNRSTSWLQVRRVRFSETLEALAAVLGASAFRVIDQLGNPIERNVNRALFEAEMLVFSIADLNAAVSNGPNVVRRLGRLFDDGEFDDTIRRATGDRSRTLERTHDVAEALEAAGVPLNRSQLPGI